MGQAESSAPIIDVTYDELTYQALQKELNSQQVSFTPNRPTSILQRATMDIFGSILVYAATFIVCDLMRTMKSGTWTGLPWMIFGPWYALTGAPHITKIIGRDYPLVSTVLGDIRDFFGSKFMSVSDCDKQYQSDLTSCRNKDYSGWQHFWNDTEEECEQEAGYDRTECIQNTPTVQNCYHQIDKLIEECEESGKDHNYCKQLYDNDWNDCLIQNL